MDNYKQTTILANNYEANSIINYLQENYVFPSKGIFDLREDGQIKVQPSGDKIEIICNGERNIVNSLLELIEQNE